MKQLNKGKQIVKELILSKFYISSAIILVPYSNMIKGIPNLFIKQPRRSPNSEFQLKQNQFIKNNKKVVEECWILFYSLWINLNQQLK
jgi:hypothetical protein